MLGYFIKAGDVAVDQKFFPYVKEFRDILEEKISNKTYGEGLKLILIEYHLEGEFLSLPDKHLRVSNYRKKEQSIAVIIGVPRSFIELSRYEKKKYIVDTTFEALMAVIERMVKKGFDQIDFKKLKSDLENCSKEYLAIGSDLAL